MTTCPRSLVPGSQILLVGEAPGYWESRQGEYFIGETGIKLNEMLRAVGLSREEVSLSNALKCYQRGEVAAGGADALQRGLSQIRDRVPRQARLESGHRHGRAGAQGLDRALGHHRQPRQGLVLRAEHRHPDSADLQSRLRATPARHPAGRRVRPAARQTTAGRRDQQASTSATRGWKPSTR